MVLIHAEDGPRTRYAASLLFGRLLGVPFRLTADASELAAHEGPALVYGSEPTPGREWPFLRSSRLLEDRGIRVERPPSEVRGGALALYPTDESACAVGFDVFAATFFLVSRYEEYLSDDRDEHGRFSHQASLLYRQGFLDRPVVNEYAGLLRDAMRTAYPRYPWPQPVFTAESTIDVDVAFAYRGRSRLRTLAATARDAVRSPTAVLERWSVLRGKKPDPFDTYDFIEAAHREAEVSLSYFLLMSDAGGHDRSIDPDGTEMAQLIARLTGHGPLGLHPSYAAASDPTRIASERRLLERHAGRPINRSRHHYLRITLAETYRSLIACGIRADYSMGYAGEVGFRAGIASPFPYYDLEREEETELIVYPLAYMDGTLREYLGLSPAEATSTIDRLVANVRATGGHFVSLWHNNTVTDSGLWKGWREVFLHSLTRMGAGVHDHAPHIGRQ